MSDLSLQVTEQNGDLVVDSRLIAARLDIQHETFMRTIRKYESKIEQRFGIIRFEIGEINGLTDITQSDIDEVQAHFLRSSTNESGYMGVTFCKKTKSWKAKTKTGAKKDETLGCFETKEMAALAYYRATRESLFMNGKDNDRWWRCH